MSRYILTLIAFVLVYFTSAVPASTQVGEAHWRAWNNHERGTVTRSTTRRATKRVYVKTRYVKRTKKVVKRHTQVAKVTPSVAKPEVGEATLPTPFGVAMKVLGSLVGVPSSIQSFLVAVQSQCGSARVISGRRPGARVAGSGIISCHAMGQAADYTTSNPACALQVAAGFKHLGHSTDYGRVAHFHVSNCAREAGMRFAHYTGRSRVALASSRRYAQTRVTRRVATRTTRATRVRFAQARLPARARPTAGNWQGSW